MISTVKKHRTPKHTEEYPATHPLLEIPILETDEVHYLATNDKGNIRTNKRALDGHPATVILGNLNIHDDKIILPKDVRAWSCKVYGGGIISSIGMKDTEVTVVIHI